MEECLDVKETHRQGDMKAVATIRTAPEGGDGRPHQEFKYQVQINGIRFTSEKRYARLHPSRVGESIASEIDARREAIIHQVKADALANTVQITTVETVTL